MTRYVLRRLAVAVPLVLVVATISFFLVQLVPGSPAAAILGPTATQDQVDALERSLGLDAPATTQFVDWLTGAAHGDLGRSYVTGQPVSDALSQALAPTLSLAVLSTLLTLGLGLVMGMAAAVRGGRTDKAVQWVGSLGMAIPNFWLAALLVFVLAIELPLFPATGYAELATEGLGPWLSHLVLPVLALSAVNLGQIAFQARAAFADALGRDYVRTLQATGTPRRRVLFKHVLRNASVPVVTVTGLTFIFTLGGVVILELIFNLPGLGNLMLRSVQTNDFSVVQGGVLYFSLAVILVNLVVDVATASLDPRVRVR
ncbi:peptide/nickel transport system permease protein [Klenkia soli]|uniref:Peptide/nickel transport system permease protein n=1 Tax=Klenkia soli TaxID=1052260 RepID=A0A1H0LN27_9ACTN|nr:ABC transporter permease [Klenkia soli]SDO69618.1 peptide/nickel transport system permease protein [Klenkia soli]